MDMSVWLSVVGICLLGAMSPGPSLALVLHHTLTGGRRQGMLCGLAHGLGIGIYAFLSVLGLALLINTSPWLLPLLEAAGALYLIWLGVQGLRKSHLVSHQQAAPHNNPLRDGFLMAFFNPKAALFFFALFSQVVTADTPLFARLGYAATAMLIDMSWYVSVAWLVSRPLWFARLQASGVWFERLFAVLLISLGIGILLSLY